MWLLWKLVSPVYTLWYVFLKKMEKGWKRRNITGQQFPVFMIYEYGKDL